MSTEDRIRRYLGVGQDADVTDIAEIVRRIDGMANDTRETAFGAIFSFFCGYCGSRLKEDEHCTCMRDD